MVAIIREEEVISAVVLKVQVAINEEVARAAVAIAEVAKAVDIKRKITTKDHRPRTKPHSKRQILNKRNSRARLPRKITREVDKAVKISRGTDHRQLHLNKLQDKSLRRKKRARQPTMEAGVP